MKKLLIMLMVVAMASFLFVGCLEDSVTPPVDEEEEPPITPTTVPPIITDVPDADDDDYVNKAEAADGIVVEGTGPTYSEIKLTIDGVFAGTGDVTATGAWTVDVAESDLGADGDKVMTATAIEAGLGESEPSNAVEFTLDTEIPFIESSVGTSGTLGVYQFRETTDSIAGVPNSQYLVAPYLGSPVGVGVPFTAILNTTAVTAGTINVVAGDYFSIPIDIPGTGGVAPLLAVWTGEQSLWPFASIPLTNQLLLGINNWKLEVINIAAINTIRVYNLTTGAPPIDYSYVPGPTSSTSWIPGLTVFVAVLNPLTDIGGYCLITTTRTAVVAGYIDVTFNEEVTGILVPTLGTGVWTAFGATINLLPAVTVRSSTVARLTETAPGLPWLLTGVSYSVSCSGPIDLAGNPIVDPDTTSGIVVP